MTKKPVKINVSNVVVSCVDCTDSFLAGYGHLIECKREEDGLAIQIPICEKCGERYKKEPERINSRMALIFRAMKNKLENMGKED